MRFCVKNMINPIIKPSIVKESLTCLSALQVEAIFAVKVTWCILALYEASVTFTSVGIPNDAGVRWGCPKAIRKWCWLYIIGRGLGTASPAWKWFTPFKSLWTKTSSTRHWSPMSYVIYCTDSSGNLKQPTPIGE
nr:hypothetical protein CFP56_49987 [Quercus suber]